MVLFSAKHSLFRVIYMNKGSGNSSGLGEFWNIELAKYPWASDPRSRADGV
jgi:hypothetical protein